MGQTQDIDTKKSGLIIFQTWHTILLLIGVFILIGISYATARFDIDQLKNRVDKLEIQQIQINRIEHNLRSLCRASGVDYEEFGYNIK